jgi:hypothetical protein
MALVKAQNLLFSAKNLFEQDRMTLGGEAACAAELGRLVQMAAKDRRLAGKSKLVAAVAVTSADLDS